MNTKVVLIVGPSGVGKDTLLNDIKKELKDEFNFVKRYITRKPDENEMNYYLDEDSFKVLKKSNFFISTWEAHGNLYGIAKNSINSGINIISISRATIKDFEKFYDKVYTINVTVSKEILKKRLELRKRETQEDIEKRLNRKYETIKAKKLIEFDNSKDIQTSVNDFLNLLKHIIND